MVKKEIEQILIENKRMHTDKLEAVKTKLETIIDERNLAKGMFFWTPGTCASDRRNFERIRNICIDTELKGLKVWYHRDYSESCRHVYAYDKITLTYNGEERNGSVADLSKIVNGINEILDSRKRVKN